MRKIILAGFIAFALVEICISQNEKAIQPSAAYTCDFGRNFFGGASSGNFYLGVLDLALLVDFEKAKLWNGGQFYLQIENTHGSTPSVSLTNDLQYFSNIENGNQTYLYMFWYKQNLGRLTATIGVHDLNSEFVVSEYAGNFTNSSFGIMPTFSLNLPVSIFPKPVLGAILNYQLSESVMFSTAIYDGEPVSRRNDLYNLDLTISSKEGFLSISEIRYANSNAEKPGEYKIGAAYHSGKFYSYKPDSDSGKSEKGNSTFYLVADQKLTENLGIFVQAGYANKNFNTNPFYVGLGINISPFTNKRKNDIAGLAIAYCKINELDESYSKNNEIAIEFNYSLNTGKHAIIQPIIQYIINPGAVLANNALVAFLRVKIEI